MVAEGVASAPVEEMVVEPVPPKLAVFAVMRPAKRLVEEALVRVVFPFKMVAPFAVKPEVNVWRLDQVLVVVVPNARLSTFELICSGYVAEVMREVYALPHSVVEAVRGMVYPAVREKTPVALVYVSPIAVEESEVELTLLLNVVKSEELK